MNKPRLENPYGLSDLPRGGTRTFNPGVWSGGIKYPRQLVPLHATRTWTLAYPNMSLSSYVATDDLTVLLGLSAAALFLLQNLYKPQPLVHPILLGRQSDVTPVRNPGESAVYRNYSTSAMGRVSATIFGLPSVLTTEPQLPLRPAPGIQTIIDLVRADVDSPRTLWSTKVGGMPTL